MMKRMATIAAMVALIFIVGTRAADAHVSVGIGIPGIVFGAPVYAPAYYPPPPVYVYPSYPYSYYGPSYYGGYYGPPYGGVYFSGRFGDHHGGWHGRGGGWHGRGGHRH